MNAGVDNLLLDPTLSYPFYQGALEQANEVMEEAKAKAKEATDNFVRESGIKGVFTNKTQTLLNLNSKKISSQEARKAHWFTKQFLVNNEGIDEVKSFKEIASKLAKDPNNEPLKEAYEDSFKILKTKLKLDNRFKTGFISEAFQNMSNGNAEAALKFIEDVTKNPVNLIEEEIRSQIINPLAQKKAILSLQNAALEGRVFKSNFHSLSLFLRKLPWIGSWFEAKTPDLETASINARFYNHSIEAGNKLLNNRSHKTLINNFKEGKPVLKETVKSSIKPVWEFAKDLLGKALKGNIKGVTKKLALPLAGLAAVTGAVKMSGPIGDFARTIVDFGFVDGAAEDLANGNMAGLAGKTLEYAGLTAASMGVAATGVTGAIALGLGTVCSPLLASIAAGAIVYGGLSFAYGAAKNTIFGNKNNTPTTQVSSNGGVNTTPFSEGDIKNLPSELKDDAKLLLDYQKNSQQFSV